MTDQPKRYRATFLPQAWIRDYAVECDPEGPTTWRLSKQAVLDFITHYQDLGGELALTTDGGACDDARDSLCHDPAAPRWIREWGGPFEITVEEDETDGPDADEVVTSPTARPKIWVLLIHHRYGTDCCPHATQEGAARALHSYVAIYWHDWFGDDVPLPDPLTAADVERYFERASDYESTEIDLYDLGD